MTIKELRERIADYPDDQFVHVRIWLGVSYIGDGVSVRNIAMYLGAPRHQDVVVDKVQQGVDGAALITVTLMNKGEQP